MAACAVTFCVLLGDGWAEWSKYAVISPFSEELVNFCDAIFYTGSPSLEFLGFFFFFFHIMLSTSLIAFLFAFSFLEVTRNVVIDL